MYDTTLTVHFQSQSGTSPFDTIRQLAEDGREFWSARDLQGLLEYKLWQNFEKAIERAMISCKVAGHEVAEHFIEVNKTSPMPNGGVKQMKDYHLTRLACYCIAMNGDVEKPSIAAAQTYFMVQTRKAETAQEPPQITQEPQYTPLQGGHVHKVISDDVRRKRLIAALNKIEEGHQEVDALLFPGGIMHQISKPKQIKAAAPTASIEDQIIKHLRKHGPLTINMLRSSYLKKRSAQELEWALGGMVRAHIVTSTDTAYGTKKYGLIEAQASIS